MAHAGSGSATASASAANSAGAASAELIKRLINSDAAGRGR
jgi:hypothetical protein